MKIKKIIMVFFAFVAVLSAASAKALKADNITIKGIINVQYSSTLALFVAQDGDWYEIARTDIDTSGNYKFVVNEPKGKIFAVASIKHRLNPSPYKARFFAKSGDNIELNAIRIWERYELGTTPSAENRYFREWVRVYDEIFPDISFETYETILEKTDSFLKQAEIITNNIKLKDKKSANLMKFYIQNDAIKGLFEFYFISRLKAPTKEQLPSFFEKFAREATFSLPLYREIPITASMIANIFYYYRTFNTSESDFNDIESDKLFSVIDNDHARVIYLTNRTQTLRSYDEFDRLYSKLSKYNYTDRQRQLIDSFIKEYKYLAKGQPAKDFTFPDVDGNMVSLSNFKGKVVVVDFWATWCGPCLFQIPYMQQLEHKFKDNDNVVIMSISVDKKADEDKWREMIKEKKLCGIQLKMPLGSDIGEWYKIVGIPHFLVFDKNGNILSAYAPRPSTPQLKKMIMEELDN